MDDSILVILTLLIIIIGAASQIKRRRTPPEAIGDESNKNNERMNFWEGLMAEEPEDVPVEQDREWNLFDNEDEETEVQEPIIEPAVEEGVSALKDDPIMEAIIKEREIGTYYMAGSRMEGFSFRRAIIFSEIIHPKYF